MLRQIRRRDFLAAAAGTASFAACGGETPQTSQTVADEPAQEAVIDFHQHTHYSGRTDEDLLAHQPKNGSC